MKKILAIILVLFTFCLSSCGLSSKGITVEQSAEHTKIVLDNFKGESKVEIAHDSLNEGGLYYSTNITTGSGRYYVIKVCFGIRTNFLPRMLTIILLMAVITLIVVQLR